MYCKNCGVLLKIIEQVPTGRGFYFYEHDWKNNKVISRKRVCRLPEPTEEIKDDRSKIS